MTPNRRNAAFRGWWWALLSAALAVTGCENRYQTLCQKASDKCAHGNEKDVDGCTIDLEAQADVAAAWECDAEWDDFMTCFEQHASCDKDDGWKPKDSCKDEKKSLRKCECDDWNSKEALCED